MPPRPLALDKIRRTVLSFLRDEDGSAAIRWLYIGLLLLIGGAIALPALQDDLQGAVHASGIQFRLHQLWPY